jgi:hypothetical protein
VPADVANDLEKLVINDPESLDSEVFNIEIYILIICVEEWK